MERISPNERELLQQAQELAKVAKGIVLCGGEATMLECTVCTNAVKCWISQDGKLSLRCRTPGCIRWDE